MRARYVAQRSVFGVCVVYSDPTGDIIRGHALPRLVILMPKYGPPMSIWLAQNKIVEELYVGAHQVFYNV